MPENAAPYRHVPYHRSLITEAEITAVTEALRSGWLTAGPRTKRFEERVSAMKWGRPCVATNSCTSAMLLALRSLNLKSDEEVITTPLTFVSTANCIVHAGGRVVFADVEPDTFNLDPQRVEQRITPKTRAILPVHLGGNPCRMDALTEIAERHGLELIEDCAHALEGEFQGQPLGTFGLAGAFSFYATKNITTAEGGMLSCRDETTAALLRKMSRHGVDKGTYQRMEVEGEPLYDVVMPGYKANMSDVEAALGLAQMDKLEEMYARRQAIKLQYDAAFGPQNAVNLVKLTPGGKSALHLYQVVLRSEELKMSRGEIIQRARTRGVELSVNYTPIHLFSWYRQTYCSVPGAFPHAEYIGMNNLSLPFYPAMEDADVAHVVAVLSEILADAQ
ncbi:MAG: DegT/DnrJ/EryC1/StrS family aminotransferase [Bacteroidota bacterium]